jgi:hypothetical protein
MKIKAWEEEDVAELIMLYTDQNQSIEYIAEYFGKNTRSIISKLVKLKIYKKPEPVKESKRSVKQMVNELEDLLDIQLDTVNIYKKQNLEIIVNAIKTKLEQDTNLN